MRNSTIVIAILLALTLFTATDSFSGDKHMQGDKKDGHSMMMQGDMQEHHKMMTDMMGMIKDTMGIVKDLNHKPTAEQKEKLSDMIDNMEGIMKMHEEKMKKHNGMKMHKGMKNPCAMKHK